MLVTLGTATGAPLRTILAWRYLIAALLLLPMALTERAPRASKESLTRMLVVGGIGQGLVASLGLSALAFIPAATSTFLFYTYPAWVTVIVAARRVEPITRRKLAALGLALTGIVIMVGAPASLPDVRGVALALSAAIVYAIYIQMIERVQKGISPLAASLVVCIGAAAIFLAAAAFGGMLTLDLHPTAWIVTVVMAVVSTAIAFRLFLAGIAVIGPVRTAIISTVEPIATAMLGWWLLAQRPAWPTWVGGALIIAAVIVIQWGASRRDSELEAR